MRLAADGGVDPAVVGPADPLREGALRQLRKAVLPLLQRDPRDEESERHEHRQDGRPAARQPEEPSRRGRPKNDHPRRRIRSPVRPHAPPTYPHHALGSTSVSDSAVMLSRCRNGIAPGVRRRDAGGGDGSARRPRLSPLDPGEQRHEQQRREIEEIPLLDAERVARREHRDLEHEPHGQRGRRRGEDAQPAVEMPRVRDEDDQRGEGHDPHVEVELGEMQDEPLQYRPEGGSRRSRSSSSCRGCATASGRARARRRRRERPRRPRCRTAPCRPSSARPPALDPSQHERRRQHRQDERHRLRAGHEREHAQPEHRELPAERRPVEHEQ